MRVLQVIDTLRPGGAENMAVNIANLLVGQIEASHLCCTRTSGVLQERLKPNVGFLCLGKRHSLDLKALKHLSAFVRKNQIDIVHAHSTSFFFATLVKFIHPKVKLVWHDHFGESENLHKRHNPVLKVFSRYFSGILVVNHSLEKWVHKNLGGNNIKQLKNFVVFQSRYGNENNFEFKGEKKSFKIICVANLRLQKNHLVLIEALEKLDNPNISLHLFGENPKSSYSSQVLERIKNSKATKHIFYYGARKDISSIMPKAQIGILASRSEGLPLVILEYALSGIPVICTKVGQNEEVVGDFGKLVLPNNSDALVEAIQDYYLAEEKRIRDANNLKFKIEKEYNPEHIRNDLLQFYNSLIN
ncbi:glycosyltransferase [Christiangramia sp. SM2212]|uniref:Glycosyltransferase n=1 Tax=Christiangramia sediminicola TaxID=3073267 RepID=A0ABU1EMV6_9FLAO|nr:glycosyltransferase [Christiangramia sp. SM2212]MDR5589720.1 glycosyltransferase [Christiangramia sp. SM2212]